MSGKSIEERVAAALRQSQPDLMSYPWEDQSPPGWRHLAAAANLIAALRSEGVTLTIQDEAGAVDDEPLVEGRDYPMDYR